MVHLHCLKPLIIIIQYNIVFPVVYLTLRGNISEPFSKLCWITVKRPEISIEFWPVTCTQITMFYLVTIFCYLSFARSMKVSLESFKGVFGVKKRRCDQHIVHVSPNSVSNKCRIIYFGLVIFEVDCLKSVAISKSL